MILLSSCASSPYSYDTSEGCGIRQWRESWVQKNVRSMSWTGACSNGLAFGSGTHVVKLKNGKQIKYTGDMLDGRIYGYGTHINSGGWKFEGMFLDAELTEGKVFDESGKIWFEGKMANDIVYQGKTITYADNRYGEGKVYVNDGSYYEGEFNGSFGMYKGGNARQAALDARHIRDGLVVGWVVEGTYYKNQTAYDTAKMQYEERVRKKYAAQQAAQKAQAAKQAAIAAAEHKAYEERRRKQNQEGWAMLGSLAGAAAAGKNSGERRQLMIAASAGAGAGSSSIGGTTIADMRVEQLAAPGTAQSKNACMKLEWITEPLPKSKAGSTILSEPWDFDSSPSPNKLKNQRHLVIYSTCTENLVFSAFACEEATMLASGRDGKTSWNMGDHVGTSFQYGLSQTGVRTDVRLPVAYERTTDNSSRAVRHRAVSVIYGAWLRSEFIDVGGQRTSNGEIHQRKIQSVFRNMESVIGVSKNITPLGREWSPSTRSNFSNVSTCTHFKGREVWNATQ